jgi:hypothetical protein
MVRQMHPIERLRYVARSSGASQALLVRETAGALSGLGFDPAGLVTACRRIVDRHVTSAPLWWLCARMLTATDPLAEAYRAADEIAADPTGATLAHALPSDATVCVLGWPDVVGDALVRRGDLDVLVVDALGEGSGLARRLRRSDMEAEEVPTSGLGAAAAAADLVLLEASAIGSTGAIAISGSRAAAAVGRHAGVPVWLVGGVGRVLPGRMWDALLARLDEASEPWDSDDECLPLDLVDQLCGPDGPEAVVEGVRRVDCPVTPELFRPTAF